MARFRTLVPALTLAFTLGCSASSTRHAIDSPLAAPDVEVFLTSSSGDRMRRVELPEARATPSVTVTVDRSRKRQKFLGVGGSLTQASAAALNSLSPEKRRQVLDAYFGPDGAHYGLSRTHIASSDFSEYSYTYSPQAGLFSIEEDHRNGLLDLIKDARAVTGARFELMASPWTAPPWMKDNQAFYDPENRRGGTLLEAHHEDFAQYLVDYIRTYGAEGIPIWAISPVNEPQGNAGSWESMDMSPSQQREVVKAIGKAFETAKLDTQIFIFDQNRAEMAPYTEAVFSDPESSAYADGTAVHWYNSTFRVYEDILDAQHALYPDKLIIQSEGTVDSLANPVSCAGTCLKEPCGCEELYSWWENDSWYWEPVATDWGWDWAAEREVDHPKYAPAMRYARDLVVSVGHWVSGWIDWNIALNKRGGPNHVSNFCLAPVMVDGEQDRVYFTPIFYVLAQFSRHARPGAQVLGTEVKGPKGIHATALENPDGSLAVHVFNESGSEQRLRLNVGTRIVNVVTPNRALQTIVVHRD